MDQSTFPWLGSNIRYSENGNLFHKILDTDYFDVPTYLSDGITEGPTVRVGVFGVCTQATPNLSSPSNKVLFEDVIQHSQRCVNILRNENHCDIVIALTHVALAKDKDIAEIVPGIDLIIGGHDHDPAMLVQQQTMIVKCGQNIDYIGLVDLQIQCISSSPSSVTNENNTSTTTNTSSKSSSSSSSKQININKSFQLISLESLRLQSPTPLPTDPTIDQIIHQYQSTTTKSSSSSNNVVTMIELLSPSKSLKYLSTLTSDVRCCEAAFTCWVADAMVWYYRSFSCQIGLINGGFVRGNHQYPQGSPLTVDMLLEEMPFPRKPIMISVKGKDIVKGIEEMLSVSDSPVGCFPHLSNGIRVVYDMNKPPLSRIQSCEVFKKYNKNNNNKNNNNNNSNDNDAEEYQPIELETYYLMVLSDFYVLKEGDNVTGFYGQQIIQQTNLVIEKVVEDYFRTLSSLPVLPPHRLIRLN